MMTAMASYAAAERMNGTNIVRIAHLIEDDDRAVSGLSMCRMSSSTNGSSGRTSAAMP